MVEWLGGFGVALDGGGSLGAGGAGVLAGLGMGGLRSRVLAASAESCHLPPRPTSRHGTAIAGCCRGCAKAGSLV